MALSMIIPSKQEFDNTIGKILKGSEYKQLTSGIDDFIQNSKDVIIKWIEKIFNKIISNVHSKQVISDNLANIFIIIGLLLIAIIVTLIIIKVSKTFEKKVRIKEILGEKINNKTTPTSLRLLAASFDTKGDYRQAIRYHFISILLLMHQKNIIYLDETKTNEEIYMSLKKNKKLNFLELKYLINDINSSWYGHRTFYKENYDMTLQNINLLWSEVLDYEEKKQ